MHTELLKAIKGIANWIEKVDQDKVCLPAFEERLICNTAKSIPAPSEICAFLRWHVNQIEHPPRICVYRAVNGWQTALHVWDNDGFYDVFSTGFGPYGHSKKGYNTAVREGRYWAENEEVKFDEPPKWEPNKAVVIEGTKMKRKINDIVDAVRYIVKPHNKKAVKS